MADNLPLLPDAREAGSTDVRMVLREVFRDWNLLPPLVGKDGDHHNEDWIDKYTSEFQELYRREEILKDGYATRLARRPGSNIYRLHQRTLTREEEERGLIRRDDLRPTIELDAGGDEKLWVKNIMNRSSGDLTVVSHQTGTPTTELPEGLPCPPYVLSDYSMSIGERVPRPQRATSSVTTLPSDQQPLLVCVPSRISFVNFVVGKHYTQSLRLINTSKSEVRISIKPLATPELDVEICSRLVITSGSAGAVRLHYRPRDVRTLQDVLVIRVSGAKDQIVPITCYMEAPLLHVLISSTSATEKCDPDTIDLGSRLLGDVHHLHLILRCDARHAEFIILSEDNWIDYALDVKVDKQGKSSVVAECFSVSPVYWAGGGTVPGTVVCYAPSAGLHAAALRVLSSTAVVRPLHLVADALMYSPGHINIQADERDYDICDEQDPNCQYYVNLGTSFPNGTLSKLIKILNISSITYDYYWSVRPWCGCCLVDKLVGDQSNEENLSPEDKVSKYSDSSRYSHNLHARPDWGRLPPRSAMPVDVQLDAGTTLGIQRAVLVLTLTDIPVESLPPGTMTAGVKVVEEDAVPGITARRVRKVCEVVCCELEVWWEVVPVAFVLHPPKLVIPHSRRVKSIPVELKATQLYGTKGICTAWESWNLPIPVPPPPCFGPSKTTPVRIIVPLKDLADNNVDKIDIRMTSEDRSWTASTHIERSCDIRHPSLGPTLIWFGAVAPGAELSTKLILQNNTHQDIYWRASILEWIGEKRVPLACQDQPCPTCRNLSCICGVLMPSRGALKNSESNILQYNNRATSEDGCIASLIRVCHTTGDDASLVNETGTEGKTGIGGRAGIGERVALVVYRVLAPRLMLRVMQCSGDKSGECKGCELDEGNDIVLRPARALTVGRRVCCRLRITNTTPVPTVLRWETDFDNEPLAVTFTPNVLEVGAYANVEVTVVLEALCVCSRRIFVRRASVEHSHPMYLLIDAAISGVEVFLEIPVEGDEDQTTATIKLSQQGFDHQMDDKEPLPTMMILDRGVYRAIYSEQENEHKTTHGSLCSCDAEMVHIPEKTELVTLGSEHRPIEIVTEPPIVKRVCSCFLHTKPEEEALCIQFKDMPVKTVSSRRLVIRSACRLDTTWMVKVRRWPRRHTRTLNLGTDQWAADVRDPGVVIECTPERGVLRAQGQATVTVSVCADTWGLYHDQITVQIEKLEPVVLDVWAEVVAAPLQFALRPDNDSPPTLWLSSSDPERAVCATNTSRADLEVHAFIVKSYERHQDKLPFRLYIRLYDVPPVCPCFIDVHPGSDTPTNSGSSQGIGVELFIAVDYGAQDGCSYRVDPEDMILPKGRSVKWNVMLLEKADPVPHSLVLRCSPVVCYGEDWYRTTPPMQLVNLRASERVPRLQVSRCEVRVAVCALDLPLDEVLRIRKRFHVKNTGNGMLMMNAKTEPPWRVREGSDICATLCSRLRDAREELEVSLPPNSCKEMCAEVSLRTNEVWPKDDEYPSRVASTTPLNFLDTDNTILLTIPLILEIDQPILNVEPKEIDLGFVSDRHTKKSYFTIKHTSATETIDVTMQWIGSEQFKIWPITSSVRRGQSERVYVQYTTRWMNDDTDEGVVRVRAIGGAEWCAVTVSARAHPIRQIARSAAYEHADHTDDTKLLPPLLSNL